MRPMQSLLRICLAISLALMLALTGQGMAVVQGSGGPAGHMVLCTGAGLVTIHLDENGNPTGPPVLCPDCVLKLLTALVLPTVPAVPTAAPPVILPVRAAPVQMARAHARAMARAPPRVA